MVKSGTFQKGQFGNPGGRPAVAKEIKALAWERTRRPLTPSRSTAEPLGADIRLHSPRLEFRSGAPAIAACVRGVLDAAAPMPIVAVGAAIAADAAAGATMAAVDTVIGNKTPRAPA